MRDLYKFICTHSLAVVCGETADNNLNEPKLCAVKIIDGKVSDTVTAALTESEIHKVVNFLADCTIIGYGTQLNFFGNCATDMTLNIHIQRLILPILPRDFLCIAGTEIPVFIHS